MLKLDEADLREIANLLALVYEEPDEGEDVDELHRRAKAWERKLRKAADAL